MDILYYSNHCPNCHKVLHLISRAGLIDKLNAICIDKRTIDPQTGQIFIQLENGKKIMLPPNIQSVPALLVVKETSTVLIKCFEGTYSGSYSGTFNAVIYGNIIKGIAKATSDVNVVTADGTVNNNQINAIGNTSNGDVFIGNLNGNNFSGTWNNSSENTNGTFSGVRTY